VECNVIQASAVPYSATWERSLICLTVML